jgi:hypothetical protein
MTDTLELVAGATAIVAFTYSNTAGVIADPPALTITWRRLYDTPTSKTWQTDNDVVRDSAGHFHIRIPCPTAGTWAAQADDGAGGIGEISWVVHESAFT